MSIGQFVISVDPSGSGTLTVTRSGQQLCSTAAQIGQVVSAQCGAVAVTITVFQQGNGSLAGTVNTAATR